MIKTTYKGRSETHGVRRHMGSVQGEGDKRGASANYSALCAHTGVRTVSIATLYPANTNNKLPFRFVHGTTAVCRNQVTCHHCTSSQSMKVGN